MNITIIIPNYNGEKILIQNLPKVIQAANAYNQGTVRILVADDHSSDGSLQFLEKFVDQEKSVSIAILQNEKQQGFSSNVNNAIRYVKTEIILLLNTDVSPSKDFIAPLIKHFKDPNVFAVGCLEKTSFQGKSVEYGRSIGAFNKGFILHEAGIAHESHKTFWVSGGSGAFRKSMWDILGGFDEIYNPFYWEDIDLSYRSMRSGYTILFEAQSVVYHDHEKGAINSHFSASKIKTIAYRNQFIFMWKNITDKSLLLQHFMWLPYHCLKALYRGDKEFFSGFLHAIFLLPNIIQSKREQKKLFVILDKEILANYI